MLANLVCSLIKHKRVTTTLAKAKAARSVAEKMVTLGKTGTIHDAPPGRRTPAPGRRR
jgi:large subunit ribosomal protein L17